MSLLFASALSISAESVGSPKRVHHCASIGAVAPLSVRQLAATDASLSAARKRFLPQLRLSGAAGENEAASEGGAGREDDDAAVAAGAAGAAGVEHTGEDGVDHTRDRDRHAPHRHLLPSELVLTDTSTDIPGRSRGASA